MEQSKVSRPRCDESRNGGGINQWFGREDDTKVTAKTWEFLEPLARAE